MKQKIKLEIKGGFRKAGVMVEGVGFKFRGKDEVEKEIELEAPYISLYYEIRGGKYTQFEIKLTLNNITKTLTGTVLSARKPQRKTVDFEFEDFNLPAV